MLRISCDCIDICTRTMSAGDGLLKCADTRCAMPVASSRGRWSGFGLELLWRE